MRSSLILACCRLATALFITQLSFSAANAGMVVLTSIDQSMSVSGEFLSLENDEYQILTTMGIQTVSASSVTCDGESCPTTDAIAVSTVELSGADTIADEMMALMLVGYAESTNSSLEVISQSGDNKVYELVSNKGFGEPLGKFSITSTSTSDGFSALTNNSISISMASRQIQRSEVRALARSGAGDMTDVNQEHIIAVDGLVSIVHPSNPVNSISIKNLTRIYNGRINNWSQLGGHDQPIEIFTRQEGSGVRATFESRVLGNISARANAKVFDTNTALTDAVTTNPNAIGVVAFAFLNNAKPLNIISECGILSRPDTFFSKTEEYPLAHRLYMYSRADTLSPLGQDFLEFATSSRADDAISVSGNINMGVERVSHGYLHGRMDGSADDNLAMDGMAPAATAMASDGSTMMANESPAMDASGDATMMASDTATMASSDNSTMMAGSDDAMSSEGSTMMAGEDAMNMAAGEHRMDMSTMGGNMNIPSQVALMNDVMGQMFRWDNLSIVFRFASASNTLERKSVLDVKRLVDYLNLQPAGTEIALVGFTDSVGAFSYNTALSTRRANSVYEQVTGHPDANFAHLNLQTMAFSELTPSACNNTNDSDRHINRRVEIWIRNPS